jgi:hypothetical protein
MIMRASIVVIAMVFGLSGSEIFLSRRPAADLSDAFARSRSMLVFARTAIIVMLVALFESAKR